MKLCVECKHHKSPNAGSHRCDHPDYAQVSLVTGSKTDSDCAIQRTSFSGCGEEGRGFEAKLPEEL